MSLSSQLPPIPLAQASPALFALAQNAASRVDAKVLGQSADGLTQVQIGRQVLNLQLPTPQPVGTTLTLALQQAEGQVQVTLVATKPPGGSASAVQTPTSQTPAPQGSAPIQQPATQVQLSAAALSGSAPVQQSVSSPTPTSRPDMALPTAPIGQSAAPLAVHSPASAVVPSVQSMSGAPQTSALPQAGPVQTTAAPGAAAAPALPSTIAPPMVAGRPAIPYAIAAPLAAPNQIVQTQGANPAVLQPVVQAIGAGSIGQHPPQMSNPAPSTPIAPPVTGSVVPANPQVALTQMVQQALPRQDSIVGLTMALASIVGKVALPEPVAKAAQQVLAQRVNLDAVGLDGKAMQNAVRNSGIFQEALLAGGQGKAAGGDLKTALLGLQRQLGAWLCDQAPVEQVHTLPPPLKGLTPRARLAALPVPEISVEPELAGKVLADKTEAALSRLRLHQHASLPDPQVQRQDGQWSLDIPVSVAGQQALLQMQIHRDPEGEPAKPEERGWQVRFAINLNNMGEVGAQISMRSLHSGVLLWAERAETAAALSAGVDMLRDELLAAGLVPGSIVVRAGVPAAQPAPSGHVVDAML